MKLLYITSAIYPSTLANRHQTLSMAKAFHSQLKGNFTLGIPAASVIDAEFETIRISGSAKSPILAWRYILKIKKDHFTHIFCREERLAFFLGLYARLLGIPLVLCFEAHFFRKEFFLLRALKRADSVVVTTNALAEDVASVGVCKDRILVIPNGIDLSRYSNLSTKEKTRADLGLPQNSFIVGYTGSIGLHDWKGVDVLLEAARMLPPEFLVWIIGGKETEVASLVEKYPAVRFEGNVENSRIPSMQNACDVLVLPNTQKSLESERYTSPLKLFEYMASGTPIVASELSSIRELVNDEMVLFAKESNPQSLVDRIESTLEDPVSARVRAASAREEVEKYVWSTRARRIIDFIS